MTWTRDGYEVSDDRDRLDIDAVHGYLTQSYWSPGIPLAVVTDAAGSSMPFGLYAPAGGQVGYARVVTDRTTVAYVCDVYVVDDLQQQGLGRWLMQCILDHPELQGLRRWILTTQDAHAFYERIGFERCPFPERFMTIDQPHAYA
ncbi:MAG: GNAT family N-acetyltransferase [Bacteroidota bacterium]